MEQFWAEAQTWVPTFSSKRKLHGWVKLASLNLLGMLLPGLHGRFLSQSVCSFIPLTLTLVGHAQTCKSELFQRLREYEMKARSAVEAPDVGKERTYECWEERALHWHGVEQWMRGLWVERWETEPCLGWVLTLSNYHIQASAPGRWQAMKALWKVGRSAWFQHIKERRLRQRLRRCWVSLEKGSAPLDHPWALGYELFDAGVNLKQAFEWEVWESFWLRRRGFVSALNDPQEDISECLAAFCVIVSN